MKLTAIVLAAVICVQTFCMGLQQTFAASSDERGPVMVDTTDSDSFYQTATRAPKPVRDNTRRIEALLARMTLEEKVGQMTQLEIGMVTNSRFGLVE